MDKSLEGEDYVTEIRSVAAEIAVAECLLSMLRALGSISAPDRRRDRKGGERKRREGKKKGGRGWRDACLSRALATHVEVHRTHTGLLTTPVTPDPGVPPTSQLLWTPIHILKRKKDIFHQV